MAEPVTMAVLALLGQAGGTLLGELLSRGDKEAARKLVMDALRRFDNISLPELEQISAEQAGPSEAGAVAADPALKAAQMSALAKMGLIEDSGGLTLEDQAAQKKVMDRVALQEKAGRARIAEQMQNRGMANSGAELAMQLENQQGAAERASQVGMDTVANAQKRYLDSILQRGRMAGAMREQDFGERFQTGSARDAINRYNTDKRERAGYYNANLPQQQFQNEMSKATAQSNASKEGVQNYNQSADDTRKFYGGMGAAARETLTPRPKSPTGYSPNWWDDDEEQQ